jgi:hypothetical protein
MKVWKILTNLTVEESENINEIFNEDEGDIIRKLDRDNEIYSWDFIDGDVFIPYLICTETVIDILVEITVQHGYLIEAIDITHDFLLGQYEIPDSDFEDYRLNNLTEDMVYEKIKKFGSVSLDGLDKKILDLSI